jgi:hypothetical protein
MKECGRREDIIKTYKKDRGKMTRNKYLNRKETYKRKDKNYKTRRIYVDG